jgi:hypothetical protein
MSLQLGRAAGGSGAPSVAQRPTDAAARVSKPNRLPGGAQHGS